MHITFFDDKEDPAVEHDWVVDAIRHLSKNCGIDLICTRESGISSIVQNRFNGVKFHHFDKKNFYTQDFKEISQISSFVGKKKSVVWLTSHYQDATTPMMIWSDIASMKDKRIMLAIKTATVRDEFDRKNYYPKEGKFVGGIIAASKTTKTDLIQAFDLPSDEIYIGYMGVNLEVFDFNKYNTNEDIHKKWGFGTDDVIIGVVGSLVPRKGHQLIFESFSQVSKEFDNVKLAIVGKGEMEEELKQRCKDSNLVDRVRFLGYHTHVASIMKMFDILILASDREGGIPRVITEAMAMKTAVISIDLGAISELIQDGVNGFLVEHRNVNSFKEKLHILLSSPDLLRKIKSNAFKSVQEFDRRIWLRKLEENFSTIWDHGYKKITVNN